MINGSTERVAEAIASLIEQLNEEDLTTGTVTQDPVSEQQDTSIEVNAPETDYPNAPATTNSLNEKLPVNSETITIDMSTSRFSSAVWYKKVQEKTIVLAGLGGIGSYCAFLLSRMKPAQIIMYDPDVVEQVNMSGQLYSQEDIGGTKAYAMTNMVHNYSDYFGVFSVNDRFTEHSSPSDIMICGFDNMTARKIFFDKWLAHVLSKPLEERKHCLFIDGRLAAEEFQVLCLRGDDEYNIARYNREWLFTDNEADITLCSYKQTTFMANMIGSVMTNLFVNFCANDLEGEEKPMMERDLPFLTTYDASMMMFSTEA